MTQDPKTKALAIGTTTGNIIGVSTENDSWTEIGTCESSNEIPCSSLECLERGENIILASFINGNVRIMKPDMTKLVDI